MSVSMVDGHIDPSYTGSMTPQEAIQRIKQHNEIHSKNERFAIYITEALNMAVEVLEKQIPKKPIENGIGGYICPHCQGVILDLPHELYHRDCGGRLE